MNRESSREINLVLGGEAGQGLQTIAQILARMFMNGGLQVVAASEFMSRIRGGSNSVTLRAAPTPVRALSGKLDLCVLLDRDALPRLRSRCGAETLRIGDPQLFAEDTGILPLPLRIAVRRSTPRASPP